MNTNGPFFAILTPFKPNGDIDFGIMGEYLSFLNHCGVKNIIINGTTAEFASLTIEERKEIAEFCPRYFKGTIIDNISSTCLRDSLDLLESGAEFVDGVILLPPYYYAKTEPQGVYSFFEKVLRKSAGPVFLYNFPLHTQFNISPEMAAGLYQEFNNLVGIKDSGGDINNAAAYKEAASPDFKVFLGGDSLAFEALQKGLDGSVTGAGNPVPEFLVEMYKNFVSGNSERAQSIQEEFNIWNAFRKSINHNEIAVAKAALSTRIKDFPSYVRPPFTSLKPEQSKLINDKMINEIIPLVKRRTT